MFFLPFFLVYFLISRVVSWEGNYCLSCIVYFFLSLKNLTYAGHKEEWILVPNLSCSTTRGRFRCSCRGCVDELSRRGSSVCCLFCKHYYIWNKTSIDIAFYTLKLTQHWREVTKAFFDFAVLLEHLFTSLECNTSLLYTFFSHCIIFVYKLHFFLF